MTRTSILFLALLAACTSDSLDYPQPGDPTPFGAVRDDRIATSTGLDTLPLGDPVGVELTLPGFTQFFWELDAPPGSSAQLSDPGATRPIFTPDVAGDYTVRLTATDALGMNVQAATRRFSGGDYLGGAACAQCHDDKRLLVQQTQHASVFTRIGATLFAQGSGCFSCHVLDPVPSPAPPPSGSFGAAAAAEGLDPATYAYTTFDQFAVDFPQSAALANVQCENCHGPGSEHLNSDPRRISVPLRAEVCGICHTGVVGPNIRVQWTNSAHGLTPPAAAVADPSCRRCHTARGFIDTVEGLTPQDVTAGAPGTTCAACHDPHDATNAAQVRIFGTVSVGGGSSYNGGRAAACLVCHQSGVQDPAAYALANNGPPCATQSDMIATRGGIEYTGSYSSSFHARTTFRLRPFTSDPADSDTPDSCVICHMAPSLPGLEDEIGEHSVRMTSGATSNVASCNRCHSSLTTFDRVIGEDFDGDARIDGVQTEVRRVLALLASAIFAADTGGAVTQPGGPATPMQVAAGLPSTAVLREAVYNYNFVVIDGSFGIHNTTYTVQILQRTYGELTGVPFGTAFPDADLR